VKGPSAFSPLTREAASLLGDSVRAARRHRRWTVNDLAERVGVSPVTIRKVERGDLTVALGTAFEAAALVGVTLFDDDPMRRNLERQRIGGQLSVLASRVRRRPVDDNF
jgi:transcriptional regulator with XRE-family HTH domain